MPTVNVSFREVTTTEHPQVDQVSASKLNETDLRTSTVVAGWHRFTVDVLHLFTGGEMNSSSAVGGLLEELSGDGGDIGAWLQAEDAFAGLFIVFVLMLIYVAVCIPVCIVYNITCCCRCACKKGKQKFDPSGQVRKRMILTIIVITLSVFIL